ncbi:hypothetical protein BZG36_01134 [Bifiguratus adelaidae]|uniref:DAGKc domain-containing protein n=1 Tax=Bifiguratus adelaidae TaxID=1938954 RepID=A0A261Y663_9FUNG|nr:hypothetical protein BZG36_01134 [Bifiguratus adelaidae]
MVNVSEGPPLPSKENLELVLFVNPLAGNKQGEAVLKVRASAIEFKGVPRVRVHVYSLIDDADRQAGYDKVKELIEALRAEVNRLDVGIEEKAEEKEAERLLVCAAGGDGTLTSIVDQLDQQGLDISKINFALVPFGTGNDLARYLGTWELDKKYTKDILQDGYLRELLFNQIRGVPKRHDLWTVTLKVYDFDEKDGGSVCKVLGPKSAQNLGDPKQNVTLRMANNGAIGAQAYVGGDAEKHRKSSRVFNIAMYVMEAAKWGAFKTIPNVGVLLERIEILASQELAIEGVTDDQALEEVMATQGRSDSQASKDAALSFSLSASAIELVWQNIPAIWGRTLFLWDKAEHGRAKTSLNDGKEDHTKRSILSPLSALTQNPLTTSPTNSPHPEVSPAPKTNHDSSLHHPHDPPRQSSRLSRNTQTTPDLPTHPDTWTNQSASDGKIEMFAVENRLSYLKKELAVDRTQLARIGQFGGGFRLIFKPPKNHQPSSSSFTGHRQRAHAERESIRLMVDGEFFVMRKPKVIEVRLWKQIWVMQSSHGRVPTGDQLDGADTRRSPRPLPDHPEPR